MLKKQFNSAQFAVLLKFAVRSSQCTMMDEIHTEFLNLICKAVCGIINSIKKPSTAGFYPLLPNKNQCINYHFSIIAEAATHFLSNPIRRHQQNILGLQKKNTVYSVLNNTVSTLYFIFIIYQNCGATYHIANLSSMNIFFL